MEHGLTPASDARFEVAARVAGGKPSRTICDVAEDSDARTIVMGARGLSRAGSVLLGSVWSRRRRACPASGADRCAARPLNGCSWRRVAAAGEARRENPQRERAPIDTALAMSCRGDRADVWEGECEEATRGGDQQTCRRRARPSRRTSRPRASSVVEIDRLPAPSRGRGRTRPEWSVPRPRASASGRSRSCSENRYPVTTSVPITTPAATAKRATFRTKPSVPHGPVLGARARKNVGMPIVKVAATER